MENGAHNHDRVLLRRKPCGGAIPYLDHTQVHNRELALEMNTSLSRWKYKTGLKLLITLKFARAADSWRYMYCGMTSSLRSKKFAEKTLKKKKLYTRVPHKNFCQKFGAAPTRKVAHTSVNAFPLSSFPGLQGEIAAWCELRVKFDERAVRSLPNALSAAPYLDHGRATAARGRYGARSERLPCRRVPAQ